MSEYSQFYEEVISRITKLVAGQTCVDFPEFTLTQAMSIQIHSKRLSRVVFMYYKISARCRQFPDNPKIQSENEAETARLLPLMRSIMVLEDLADA